MSSANRPLKFGPQNRHEYIYQDSEVALRIEYDGNNNPIYVGRAIVGTLDGEEKWQIAFNEFDANNNLTSTTWPQNASGKADASYIFEWDERGNYTFS